MGQQWLSVGTGVWQQQNWEVLHVACILLEEVTISPTIEPRSRWPTNLRTTIPEKFSPYCKCSRVHKRFLNLGTQQRDWKPPVNLTLKASGIWLQNFHRTGERDSWRAQTKPCVHQGPGESSSDPHKTEPDLPMRAQSSPAEVWASSDLPQGQWHWLQRSWEPQHAGVSRLVGGCHYCHYTYQSLASGQTMRRKHSPTHQKKIGLKIYWPWPYPPD